jgi:predicted TIM-barrel fold metal-dependent hydrolase
MTGRKTLLGALLLAGCTQMNASGPATGAPAASPPRIGATPRNQIVPLLDAHQHMMGPAAMTTLTRQPSPPQIAVPAAIAEMLSARERGVDQASYAALFSADAQVFAEEQGRWWVGKDRILDSLGNFGAGRKFVPTSFAADQAAGFVSGILRSATGEDTHNFVLGIRKGPDGRWRIASEMKQPIMPPLYAPSITADKIIEVLDDAGMRYATVLSTAYWFGDPEKAIAAADRLAGTRAENDWVIAQAQRYPDRLIPFCGVNPVADYAIAEMERCAGLGIRGMKIHRNSKFDPGRPNDLEGLKRFFRAANRLGVAVVVHLRGDTRLYIDQVFPEAPDIPIQIAHMGSGWANAELFAEAIEAKKPGTRNLWFDWTQALPIAGLWGYGPSVSLSGNVSDEGKAKVVGIMRRIGLGRILYGSDMPLAWNPTPREWWRKTILTLPLTDDEIRDMADNLPPYVPG